MAEQYNFVQRLLQMSDSSPPTFSTRQEKVFLLLSRDTPYFLQTLEELPTTENTPEQTDPKLTRAVALPDFCAQAVSRHRYITLLQAQAVLLLSKPRRNARLKDTGLSWCLRGKRHRL